MYEGPVGKFFQLRKNELKCITIIFLRDSTQELILAVHTGPPQVGIKPTIPWGNWTHYDLSYS